MSRSNQQQPTCLRRREPEAEGSSAGEPVGALARLWQHPSPELLDAAAKDADATGSNAPTSDSSDCGNDSQWEELSTGSCAELDADTWSARSHSPMLSPRASCEPLASARAETSWQHGRLSCLAAAGPVDDRSQSAPGLVSSPSSSAMVAPRPYQLPHGFSAAQHQHPHQQRQAQLQLQPRQFHPRSGKHGGLGAPLHLTPVHLAALAGATAAAAAAHAATSFRRPLAGSNSSSPRLRPVVQPIHIGPPTEYDFRNTNGLMKCLNSIAPLPSPEELSAKHLVISELERIVDQWLRETSFAERRCCDDNEAAPSATMLLGGSWHLKVGLSDSDLDVVALMPRYVSSELFFESLSAYLRGLPSVRRLVAMTKAAVPILSFQLHGVRVDLLYARFTQDVVPKHLSTHSDHILAGMDVASIRSLSVPRVASLILELVPNDTAFRSCLRIIRLWAKRRGIYSNKAGFLGGVSWTVLVAFICQMFPKATLASVIHRFFSVLSTWSWPTPILLTTPYDCPAGVDSSLQWCPQKNHHDRAHLMPIITPGFPAVNSSVNVNVSTLRIIKDELERGKQLLDEMLAKGLSSPAVWHRLFAPSELLVRYDHYVVVELRAASEDDLLEWSNYVSSRTRKLVESLQHTAPIQAIHPYPDLVRPTGSPSQEEDAAVGYYFVGYSVASSKTQDADKNAALTCAASAIRYFIATELEKAAERRAGMDVSIVCRRWQELPEEVFPQGRAAAAGDRARFILSKAHSTNVALGLGR
ncbi:hypothetical protein P43SY_009289 [Pythium insidiosum]|uniref:polynucleotide adenylyltransferase n=1 Tax=Pythium insidiosum TaxID=114742 RepID=A0AAD5Q527_PYTIN|nr:hypothetical protein P43SY_009289 [Pythium insidiosum]